MKLKNILLTGLSMVLVAALSIAGTVAYLQDDDSAVNVMTLGNVYIEQIEQERDENGKLVPFTQAKPALPAVGEVAWNDDTININGHDYKMFGEKLKNVVDKIVTVKNTGKTDAFVRTIIAIEDPFAVNHIGINVGAVGYTQSAWFVIKIDGVQYSATAFTYDAALKPNQASLPSLLQAYLNSATTNEDCAQLGATWEILTLSQGIQAAGFANADAALTAGFGAINADNIAEWFKGSVSSSAVADDKAFEDALTSDEKTIVVTLNGDVTYDIAAWANEAMGGEATEQIIINGNGHTITFNNTNSDWNNVVTNGAKLIINNATITNSGYNATSGTWNGHDITFNCEVEFNNVTFLNAVAVEDNAVFNNCKITDDSTDAAYMLWISANGQNVVLNGCEIDATSSNGNDRGIKIDEQYVGTPAKVTLTVKDTTFKTDKKSAILVKSAAGAEINLSNLDIYGVTADPVNAVWVDEASAAYADLVTVNGGKKIVENQAKTNVVASKSEMKNALTNAVANGETDIVINANGETIDMNYGLNTSTVPAGTTVTIYNANIAASSYGNAVAGTVVFENCTFENPNGAYSIHFDAGNGNVVFNNCTLAGWCSFGTAIKSVEMNNCTILGNGIYAMTRFYQDTVMNNCVIDCSNTRTGDAYVDGLSIVVDATLTLNNCTLTYCDLEVSDGGKIVADGNVLLENADYTVIKNADR